MPTPEDLCLGCMAERTGSPCSACGWVAGTPPESPAYLWPGTILNNGRYLIGRVLGAGGFGITYLGWDLTLDDKLAIKEYFPTACGLRNHEQSTVVPATTQAKDAFAQGLTKFLDEGKALTRFRGHPGIISVFDCFSQNNTSYIVMKFEDGHTLEKEIEMHGGRLPVDKTVRVAMHVMDALRAVHAKGILHRDISPDNILINSEGQVKVLDFGSAKRDMTIRDTTLQVTLKRGYSPEEQYHGSGNQGPWTDVYAVAATIYKCLTGERPPEALDRMSEDKLRRPSALGVRLPARSERALMKGLAVRPKDRFQTMAEFQEAFPPAKDEKPIPPPDDDSNRSKKGLLRWIVAGAAALAALAGIGWGLSDLFAAPVIRTFAIDPPVVAPGKPATLRWSAARGTVTIEPGIGKIAQASGTREVKPSGTTTYILTARTRFGSASRTATVTVTSNPVSVNFNAEPATIRKGATAELVWSVTGEVKGVSIEPGIGPVDHEGRLKVSPTADTTYTLVADGNPPTRASATILMAAPVPKPEIASLSANPTSMRKGESAVLTWAVTGENAFASFDQNLGRVKLKDTLTVSPQVTTTYTLQARNPGGSVTKTVTVEVVQPQPPVIKTFKLSRESLTYGESAMLTWAVGGQVDSVRIVPGFETAPPEGTLRVAPKTTTTYRLSASGPGGTAEEETTVQVAGPKSVVIHSFTANPPVVGPKGAVILQWSVSGDVDRVVLSPGEIPVQPSGELRVNPEATTRYILHATGPGGVRSSQAEVQVSSEPVKILAFDAKPNKVKKGRPIKLSWKVSGPMTALSIRPGIGGLTEREGSVEVTPEAPTEYVLTLQVGSQLLTKSVKVNVTK